MITLLSILSINSIDKKVTVNMCHFIQPPHLFRHFYSDLLLYKHNDSLAKYLKYTSSKHPTLTLNTPYKQILAPSKPNFIL